MQQHKHCPIAIGHRGELLKGGVLGRDDFAFVGGLGDADIARIAVPEPAWKSICHLLLAPPPHGSELPRPLFQVAVFAFGHTRL